MATQYTSLLGLALPVTGELSGSWGDVVNDSITSLLDSAISGTTSITTDADTTLTTTTGAANQARQAIILWNPASGTVTRNITAPAQSKIYTVINASGGTQSIVFRGAGPTTGVTIVKGESAVVAWNGTDFIKISNAGGSASFTNVTVSGTTTLSGLTASTALALDASKNVVSVTNTGTGNNVLSASPTLTGTISGANASLSGTLGVTGVATFTAQPILSSLTASQAVFTDGSKGLVSNAVTGTGNVVMSASPTLTGTITAAAANFSGAVALGDAAADNITVNGTVTSNLLFTDNTYDIGALGATRPRDLFLSRNLTVGGTLTLAGGVNLNGNVTVGDSSADTLTINSTITSNLIFTDNTYDIGASGATRPRNLFLAGNATVGGNIVLTGSLDLTNLEVTNIKAKDGTAGMQIADSTGVVSFTANPVISGGTANGVAYLNGSKVLTTGSALTFDGTNFIVGASQRLLVGRTTSDVNNFGAQITGASAYTNGVQLTYSGVGASALWVPAASSLAFGADGASGTTELMRLTSTGLGIGTSSPTAKLDVVGGAKLTGTVVTTTGSDAFSAGSGTGTSIRVNALFKGTDASGNARTSYIGTNIHGTDGSMEFSNNIAGLTMSISPSGNVGIGTSSPATKLHVNSGAINNVALFESTDSVALSVYKDNTTTLDIGLGAIGDSLVFVNSVERMRLDSSGNLGIGTTSPTNRLSVTGNANVTGNVTLGDATTDTVTVNGYMGVGGAAGSTSGIIVQGSALTSTSQTGITAVINGNSSATSRIRGFASGIGTTASAFTVTDLANFWASNASKGAGSTITNQHGIYIADQTEGTNNYGITSLVSSGTNKWNIYASGTAANYFAGNVGIGTSLPDATYRFTVSGTGGTAALVLNRTNTGIGGAKGIIGWKSVNGYYTTCINEVTDSGSDDGGGLVFRTMSGSTATNPYTVTERMRLDSSGNLLVGTTTNTNSSRLVVNGTISETVGGVQYQVVSQADIGTAPNEIPLNQYLGEMAYMNAEAVVIQPQASVTPNGIGDMVFQLTNDTTLVVKVKGSDGTVRSVTLTLA